MVNYQKLCEKTVKIARETGSFVKNFRLNNTPNVETKGKNDFVTQIDKASEQKLVEALGNLLPEGWQKIQLDYRPHRWHN